ncbi:uncharacterized protein LOC130712957 [Lotus japonicus]|uniref:uncharacterized protein LOC130712957 n=1 Tax=Lotus japonicus TaxID=34305 RepID=UPI0025852C68|nr:uncharacterized protein LOC130712957 [Lotus japonicus]
MGCAAVARDGHGRWVTRISQSFNQGRPFLAEVLALELGLKLATKRGIRKLVCWSDCAELVTLLQVGSDIENFWNRDEIQRVRQLMVAFEEIDLVNIVRDKNNSADALAREACRIGTPFQQWNQGRGACYIKKAAG